MENLTIEKRVNLKIKDHFTDVDVEIELPEINLDNCDMAGDWGPNFTCPVSPNDPIVIKYKNLQNGEEVQSVLKDESLRFTSPMSKEERDKTPFWVNIFDPKLKKEFTLKFDQEGKCHA